MWREELCPGAVVLRGFAVPDAAAIFAALHGITTQVRRTTRTSMSQTWTLVGPDRKPHASDQPGTLGGHRRSRIYGCLDCPAALRAIARGGYVTHRVFFLTEDHARAAGYRPCGVCLPATYASWKARQASVQGASGIRGGAWILLAAGMDIVGKQAKLLVLGEGDHMRACTSSLAVIDWRSGNSEP